MSRNLDTSLAAALSKSLIQPVILAMLTLTSGPIYVWSGVGNLVFGGNTYLGVGQLGRISAISEGSGVSAEGMSLTLGGIGTSLFPASDIPPGVSNPVTVPTGQFVAWAVPESAQVFDVDASPGTVVIATPANPQSNTNATAYLAKTNSSPINVASLSGATWSDFVIPTLPNGAEIQAIYPVMTCALQRSTNTGINNGLLFGPNFSLNTTGAGMGGTSIPMPSGDAFGMTQVSTGVTLGTDLSILSDMVMAAYVSDSELAAIMDILQVGFVGFAIYYAAPSNTANLINQAIADISLGAPANVYFGLMSSGQLIGTPYRVFAGQIDQPDIKVNAGTASITIALENKLSNLLRPTGRRYTSADQHLQYPDDIGFNWVEILNDVALRWGS